MASRPSSAGRSPGRFLASLVICAASLMTLEVVVVRSCFAGTASYHIGNSLTWSSQPNGLATLAASNGKNHAVGYHIHTGWSLNAIWNRPTEITLTNSFGGFTTALSGNAWDYVTLQPHQSNTTLATDTQRIVDFISLNEASPSEFTDYFIYATWPRQPGDYKVLWTQSVSSASNQPTIHAREYYDRLYDAVTNVLGNAVPVHIIPVGEVLYQLDLLFESGAVPGFTDVSQLYGDDIHLNSDIGGWIAACTVYATIFKEDPTGLQKPEGFYLPSAGNPSALTDSLNKQLQALVWDVVSHHPATGVDITPGLFSFQDEISVEPNVAQISNAILVTDINAPTEIAIINGEYAINNREYTASTATVKTGDSVSVRLISPDSYSASASATLTIGGVSDTFSVTTLGLVDIDSNSNGDIASSSGGGCVLSSRNLNSGIDLSVLLILVLPLLKVSWKLIGQFVYSVFSVLSIAKRLLVGS